MHFFFILIVPPIYLWIGDSWGTYWRERRIAAEKEEDDD